MSNSFLVASATLILDDRFKSILVKSLRLRMIKFKIRCNSEDSTPPWSLWFSIRQEESQAVAMMRSSLKVKH